MTPSIDETADQLTVVTSGEALSSVPVVSVTEDRHELTLILELPSGDRFSDTFTKPPVWGPNCALKDLVEYAGVDPSSLADLQGTELPCDRTITDTGIDFYVDREKLTETTA